MPTSIDWLDNTKSVIHCRYGGAQDWSDLYQAASLVAGMMSGVRHTVHILIDAQQSVALPRSSPFPHFKRAIGNLPANTGAVIIISQKLFIKMALSLVSKFYDTGDRVYLVATAEEAEAILRSTAGNPSSGAVADIIPAMAQAIAAASSPTERRVLIPAETR